MSSGSWTLTKELFERGDVAFTAELRRVHAPEQLGEFAAEWFADRRPFARRALMDYLASPMNCYRREALVKRLFKIAEAAKDDEVMGAMLVAFDRTIRRKLKFVSRSKYEQFESRIRGEAALRSWETLGFINGSVNSYANGSCYAFASKRIEVLRMPNNAMPRPGEAGVKRAEKISDGQRERLERKHLLFSLPTRRYLRRRAWRYFRSLGKTDPRRYVDAAARFLTSYTDADVDSELHLLDNWGLVHGLFRDCPALVRPAKGWEFLPGRSISDLAFAPYCADEWTLNPERSLELLVKARCRTVRLFAVWLLRTNHAEWLTKLSVAQWLELADHADADVSAFGFELLEAADDLADVPVEEWMRRLQGDDLERLTRLGNLLTRKLDAGRVSLAVAMQLACHRSRPVAALGFVLVQQKPVELNDASTLLTLTQAECVAVRPDLTTWLRGQLSSLGPVQPTWVLEFLDSKHEDVREIGWLWFLESAVKDEPSVWHKLMESPYADIRDRLTDRLTAIQVDADVDVLRQLWATMLCDIQRGGRHKPGVVAKIVTRIERDPEAATSWLPLLAVAVRSLRRPEFRAGLTGVVVLCETKPELLPLIRQQFPELIV